MPPEDKIAAENAAKAKIGSSNGSLRTRFNRRRFRRRTAPGAAPGSLVSDPSAPRPKITVLAYSPSECFAEEITDFSTIPKLREQYSVVWINVDGIGDAKVVSEIGHLFSLHQLALEDVLSPHQRPKLEHYPDHYYLVARLLHHRGSLETEQLSLFLGSGFIVTFQEDLAGDPFDPVRERIKKSAGKLRHQGADYLAYALLDAIIDSYFPILEELLEQLDRLDLEIFSSSQPAIIGKIHGIKRDLLTFRRVAWPLRDVIAAFLREGTQFISELSRTYMRDCYDHLVQIIDLVETSREIGSDLIDVHLSMTSFRLNEVMKVLTIISTIFIPLTFIVGVYGMNFDGSASPWNMPELRAKYGYPVVVFVMISIALGLLIYFRRKGWIAGKTTVLLAEDSAIGLSKTEQR